MIRNKYECELQGARQHLEVNVPGWRGGWGTAAVACPHHPAEPERPHPFQSEKLLLYDTLQGELQERIQRLEEDRQSLDISSGEAALGAALSVPSAPRTPALPAQGAGSMPENLLHGLTVWPERNQAQKGPCPVPVAPGRLSKSAPPHACLGPALFLEQEVSF